MHIELCKIGHFDPLIYSAFHLILTNVGILRSYYIETPFAKNINKGSCF